jgi:hypothetical protein
VKLLFKIRNGVHLAQWRATLTGERLGWAVFKHENEFSPVHRVLSDPLNGPVVLVDDEVHEVEEDDEVRATREEALDAYYDGMANARGMMTVEPSN